MLNSYNAVGRLCRDPEVQYTSGKQTPYCKFTLAVDRDTGKDKEKATDFVPCSVMGSAAESMAKYLAKGMQVAVAGRLQSGSYTNKEGQTVYTLDVFCSKVHFLEWKDKNQNGNSEPTPEGFSAVDETIPF